MNLENLEKFHRELLGKNPEVTPLRYRLSEVQRSLYSAVAEGKRGYRMKSSGTKQDAERFLATFVVALRMTRVPTSQVTIIVAPSLRDWAVGQIKETVRHLYRERKNADPVAIQVLDSALGRLFIGTGALQLPEEPECWVAYGFNNQDLLPPWMRNCLLLK
jgi:hypothetical protein